MSTPQTDEKPETPITAFHPTKDWIVTKQLDTLKQERKAQGLWRPQELQNPKVFAEVIAVGPGRVYPNTSVMAPMPCKVGDVVMMRKAAGDETIIDGDVYYWNIPDEILAVVNR